MLLEMMNELEEERELNCRQDGESERNEVRGRGEDSARRQFEGNRRKGRWFMERIVGGLP